MDVKQILQDQKTELTERFGVKLIAVFGSFASGNADDSSDVDLFVEFERPSFDAFMDLAFYLEELLGRTVDLLTPAGLNSIRVKRVEESIRQGLVYV